MISEHEMVNKAVSYLKNKGYDVATEVPFLQRSIDVVYKKEEKFVAIEFKLNNWRRALIQARTHNYGADEVYICIPEPKRGDISELLKEELNKTNIGLILFDLCDNKVDLKIEKESSTKNSWDAGYVWLSEAFNKRLEDEKYDYSTSC